MKLKSKNSFLKRISCIALSLMLCLTSFTLAGFVPTLEAEAATNSDSYEVNGYVDIDPVIYVHGTFTGSVHDISDNHMYDYMMNGDRVADGSYNGEYETKVSINEEKTLDSIVVTDTENSNNPGAVSLVKGKLTGNLGGTYSTVNQSKTNETCTLRFCFTDGTYEERTVAVKANPVDVHTIAAMYECTFDWGWKYNFGAIGTTALGSVKGSSPSPHNKYDGAYSAKEVTDKNFADIYRNIGKFSVFDVYPGGTGDWTVHCDSFTDDTYTVDKTAGYYLGVSYNENATRTCTAYSNDANYYLDLSSDKNLGITHRAGSKDFSLNLRAYNIYTADGNWGSTITSNFSDTSGTTTLSASSGINVSKSTQTDYHEDITINGTNATAGEIVTGTFTLSQVTAATDKKVSKPNVVTNIKIKIVDKSEARKALENALTAHKYSNCYTSGTWADYKLALKNLEAYINNYEADASTSYQQGLINSLNTAADNLQHATKTESTHTACTDNPNNPETIEPTCTEDGNIHHKYDCGYVYDETISALGHSFENDSLNFDRLRVDSDAVNNGYYYAGCKLCGVEDTRTARVYDKIDWSTYDSQKRILDELIKDRSKFTDASFAAFQNDYNTATSGFESGDIKKSQTFIDNKVKELYAAKDLLKSTVTLNIYDFSSGNPKQLGNSYTKDVKYLSTETLSIPEEYQDKYTVYQWKIYNNGVDKVIGSNSYSINAIVNDNVTYNVYLKKNAIDEAEADTKAVVTLVNKSNNAIDIAYIAKSETAQKIKVDCGNRTITIGDVALTAPKYAFYNLKGFDVNGTKVYDTAEIVINDNITIRPIYSASSTLQIDCASAVSINGNAVQSYQAKWDEPIVIKADREVVWYTVSNGNEIILAKGDTFRFRANENIEILTKDVPQTLEPCAKIGYFQYDVDLNKVTVVNNFFVPEGKTVRAAGVILSTKTNDIEQMKKQSTGKFIVDPSKFTENGNQVRISVTRTANNAFNMHALAYVEFTDDTVCYSKEVVTCSYTPA